MRKPGVLRLLEAETAPVEEVADSAVSGADSAVDSGVAR